MNSKSTKIKFSIHYECEIEVQTEAEAAVYMQMLARYLPPANSARSFVETRTLPTNLSLDASEESAIERTLQESKGNISLAAKLLGITRATLYSKMKKYGLEVQKELTNGTLPNSKTD